MELTGGWRLADPEDDGVWQQQRAAAREDAWRSLVGTRFAAARLADLDERTSAVVAGWVGAEVRSNVLVVGPVGVGKTHLACAMARALWDSGRSVTFRPEAEMLDRFRPGRAAEGDEWEATTGAYLLVLDDVGLIRATDWTDERESAVVNRRWLDCRPIVATTNYPPKDLRQRVGERTYSRLVGGAEVVVLRGPDRRQAR